MKNNDIFQLDGFSVTGFSSRTKNSEEFNPETAKIPALWSTFFASGIATQDAQTLAVYSDYESDEKGSYTYTVGIKNPQPHEGLSTLLIPSGKYLVFTGKGPMPQTVIKTWQEIWRYFESSTTHQRTFNVDFEIYLAEDEVNIYIGV